MVAVGLLAWAVGSGEVEGAVRVRPERPARAVVVAADAAVTVRLRVAPRASIGDDEWLTLEVENRGPAAALTGASYEIDLERFDGRTGVRLAGGRGLVAGWGVQLCHTRLPVTVGEGGSRLAALSGEVTDALGVPGRNGVRVRANLFLSLNFADGRHLDSGRDGVTVEFDWLAPDGAAVDAARARLRRLLRRPRGMFDCAGVATLLGYAPVGGAATRDDLLAALADRWTLGGERAAVQGALAEYRDDPVVRESVRRRIDAGDPNVLDDIGRARLWHPSFVGPLVRLFESDPGEHALVLTTLDDRRADWSGDPAVTRRLGAAVRKHFFGGRTARSVPEGQGAFETWAAGLVTWAMTGDPDFVAEVRPLLDDRRTLAPAHEPGVVSPYRAWRSIRPCDAAVKALLVHWDGRDHVHYALVSRAIGFDYAHAERLPPEAALAAFDAASVQAHDLLIAEAKRRLEADR